MLENIPLTLLVGTIRDRISVRLLPCFIVSLLTELRTTGKDWTADREAATEFWRKDAVDDYHSREFERRERRCYFGFYQGWKEEVVAVLFNVSFSIVRRVVVVAKSKMSLRGFEINLASFLSPIVFSSSLFAPAS